jgi:AcrR family transcriptional regulator
MSSCHKLEGSFNYGSCRDDERPLAATGIIPAPRRHPTPRRATRRRARLLARRGLLGTRIEDIRRAAGASPSSVYNLFDGLPSLTVALLARTFERLFAHVTSQARTETRPDAAIRALVDGHLQWVPGHEDEARFMYGAMALELATAQREELAELKAKLAVPVMEHLSSLVVEGALPAWPASTLEVVVLGPAHEACRRYLAGAPVDLAGLRGLLPEEAWKSVSAFAAASPALEPTAG